jgi:hypothetical protein
VEGDGAGGGNEASGSFEAAAGAAFFGAAMATRVSFRWGAGAGGVRRASTAAARPLAARSARAFF